MVFDQLFHSTLDFLYFHPHVDHVIDSHAAGVGSDPTGGDIQ